MIKLVSWNVNGIRAITKKGFWDNIKSISPDILGIQETKADIDIMNGGAGDNFEYSMNFHSASNRKGYSGVATYISLKWVNERLKFVDWTIGLGIEEFDLEGRIVRAHFEYNNAKASFDKIVVINGYYPQGGRGPERIEYKIKFYKAVFDLAEDYRRKGYAVILCGDFNTTVTDIDLARPKENRKTTGCLPEEREALNWFLKGDYIDTFRHFYPDKPDMYSYWDQITRARERNVGWRIDYFIVSKELEKYLVDAEILMEIIGSDHCPVTVTLDL
jgi:exodeoxyribonuclease-3